MIKLFAGDGKISPIVYALLFALLAMFALLPQEPDAGFRQGGDNAGVELIHPTARWALDWGMPLWPVLTETVARKTVKLCAPEIIVSVFFVTALAALADVTAGLAGIMVLVCVLWFCSGDMAGLFYFFTETRAYCALVAISALYLFLWTREPCRKYAFLSGAAIAASLSFKSPLFFLPVFVCLYMLWRVREVDRKQLLVFICAAYSFSLIWGLMQRAVYGHWVFTEWHRADANIVGGALGLTGTTEGDITNFVGLPDGANVLPWAIHETVMHPLRYLTAVGHRLGISFVYAKWYWIAGLAGFWINRRRKEWVLLFLLCMYFLLLHCTMPVETRYLQPLLPVLLCAGCGIIYALPKRSGLCRPSPFAGKIAAAVLIAIAPFFIYTTALVAAYPVRAKYFKTTVAQALAHDPDNYMLLQLRSQELRDEGSAAENLSVWEKLYAFNGLDLYNERVYEGYALALMLSGKPGGLVEKELDGRTVGARFLKTLELARAGKKSQAAAEYERVLSAAGAQRGIFRGWGFAWDVQVYHEFSSPDRQQRIEEVDKWLRKIRREQRMSAIQILDSAGIDVSFYAYSWVLEYENKFPEDAYSMIQISLKKEPQNATYLSERGIIQARRGKIKDALADINKVIAFAPDNYPAHMSKGALLADYLGDIKGGCAEYRRGLELCKSGKDTSGCDGVKKIMKELPGCN
jgi:tetratricopeptide (TPR) repeat protein